MMNNLTALEKEAATCGLNVSSFDIMVVDDDPDIRDIMQTIVEAEGYACVVAADGEMAYHLIQQREPDVVITDIDMPKINGIDLLKLIKSGFNAEVIVMTGFASNLSYSEFIALGASDFVQKPVLPSEMITRLNRVIRERCYRKAAKSAHEQLVLAHEELQSSYLDTIHRLVMAAEYKDEDTGDHIVRIGRFCALLSKKLGLGEKAVDTIGYAAPMHDIGKIGIPDNILLKPGKLTAEEFAIIKTHTRIGAKILANSKSDIIHCAQQIAVSHHERWDGNGYPQGLKGEKIPLVGRITALADTFDALTNRRPYKSAYPVELALEIMQKEKERQFDPDLLDTFMQNIETVIAIKAALPGPAHGRSEPFMLSERDHAA